MHVGTGRSRPLRRIDPGEKRPDGYPSGAPAAIQSLTSFSSSDVSWLKCGWAADCTWISRLPATSPATITGPLSLPCIRLAYVVMSRPFWPPVPWHMVQRAWSSPPIAPL